MRRPGLLALLLVACSRSEELSEPHSRAEDETNAAELEPAPELDFDVGPGHDLGPAGELNILYAGVPTHERGQAFLAFLRASFTRVDAIDLRELDMERADDHDVVVADWNLQWGPEGLVPDYEWPNIHLGHEFTRPIVAVAGGGRSIQSHTKMKLP